MGSMRTIKYLVVDNIVDEVPDAAPEIDAAVGSASDIAVALVKTAGVPSSGDIYLQTFRPDGSARWQPISAVTELPDVSIILAKVVRGKGPSRPAAASCPTPHHQPQPASTTHQGLGHTLGGLFKKLAVGGGSSNPGITSSGGGFGRMGGMGLGRDSRDSSDDEREREWRENQMMQELQEDAMRRDHEGNGSDGENRHGWVDMDNNAGPDPEECDHNREGWVDMDNNAGPEPEECHSDSDRSDHSDHDNNDDDNDRDDDNDNDNDDNDNDDDCGGDDGDNSD